MHVFFRREIGRSRGPTSYKNRTRKISTGENDLKGGFVNLIVVFFFSWGVSTSCQTSSVTENKSFHSCQTQVESYPKKYCKLTREGLWEATSF